jgi:hypothetical protein
MAHLRFNEQSTVGNVVSHEERILALDRLIMIRIHDPGGHRDARKILPGPIWLRLPHFGDLGEKGIVLGRRRRELFILVPGPSNERSENRALTDIFDPTWVGVGSKRKKF